MQAVFSYKGRLRRRDFALLILAAFLVLGIFLGCLVWYSVAGVEEDDLRFLSVLPLFYLGLIAVGVFTCLQTAKRLHDLGYSGWFCLVPYIQLPLLFIEGESGSNEYGPAPKVRTAEHHDEGFVNDPDKMFLRPFSGRGRIRRKEYAISAIIQVLSVAALGFMCYIQVAEALKDNGTGWMLAITTCAVSGLLLIPIAWFGLAQEVKRLHDIGFSGWFCLSPVFVIALLFVPSVNATNRWGTRPKREESLEPLPWEVEHEGAVATRMFRNPFSFRGRIRRTEYAISMICLIVGVYISSALFAFFAVLFFHQADFDGWLGWTVVAVFLFAVLGFAIWFYLAQTAKRLHDIDAPGLFCLAYGIALALIFIDGTKGPNRYGAMPKVLGRTIEEKSEV